MSRKYIETHFDDIISHASDTEQRSDESWLTTEFLIEENEHSLAMCKKYVLIDSEYNVDLII